MENSSANTAQNRFLAHPRTMLERFVHSETSGSVLLFVATVVALVWANSPWSGSYFAIWKLPLNVGRRPLFSMDLHHWIDDGLMVLFFLVVGLEIKREIVKGELSSFKQAALPIMAALGGMILPALIYFALNRSGVGAPGWGIPMATDIGFALGVLALLGKRIPSSLRVFMLALAIVDDVEGDTRNCVLLYPSNFSISFGGGRRFVGGPCSRRNASGSALRICSCGLFFLGRGSEFWSARHDCGSDSGTNRAYQVKIPP